MGRQATVAVLWRGREDDRRVGIASNERLRPVLHALNDVGMRTSIVVHRDEIADETAAAISGADGVLVWVDPVGLGEDRVIIDAILRSHADGGGWVSAHPDVIQVLGTKDVLFTTRQLGWGSDVRRHETLADLRAGLRAGLENGPRVLKPRYGNGGIGVVKVRLADVAGGSTNPTVVVHGAEHRDTVEHTQSFDELLARFSTVLEESGAIIDQPFQPRVSEGLIRCYLVGDRVVGFASQSADSLLAEPGDADRIMGLPSHKVMHPPDHPPLAGLRELMERDWVPAVLEILSLTADDLPALWDADFLRGPRDDGPDSWVLCEINCSSVTPFPPEAPRLVARRARRFVAPAENS